MMKAPSSFLDDDDDALEDDAVEEDDEEDDVDDEEEEDEEEDSDEYDDEDDEEEEDDDGSLDESDLIRRSGEFGKPRRHSHSHSLEIRHHHPLQGRSLSAGPTAATTVSAAAAAAAASVSLGGLGRQRRTSLHRPIGGETNSGNFASIDYKATAQTPTLHSLYDKSTIAEGDEDDGEDDGTTSDSFSFSAGDSSNYTPYGHGSSSFYDAYNSLNESSHEDSRRGSAFSLGSAAALATAQASTPDTDSPRNSFISEHSIALGIIDESQERKSGPASPIFEDDKETDTAAVSITNAPPATTVRRVSWSEMDATNKTYPSTMVRSREKVNTSDDGLGAEEKSIEVVAAMSPVDQANPLSASLQNLHRSESLHSCDSEDRSVATASSGGRMQRRQATHVAKQTRASSMDMVDFSSNSIGRVGLGDSFGGGFGSSSSAMSFVSGHRDPQQQNLQQISMGRSRVQRRRSFTVKSVAVPSGPFDESGSPPGGIDASSNPSKTGKGVGIRQTLARKTIHRNIGGSITSASTSSTGISGNLASSASPLAATSSGAPGSSIGLSSIDTELAIANLEGGPATEWEGVAAAAAVVQSDVKSTRHHRRYAVGDRVLVRLDVLNITMAGQGEPTVSQKYNDHQDGDIAERAVPNSTLMPVNRHGYPPGQGETSEEREGPFVFVLATIRNVHFEEDARYYTVTRADTETNQRADTEWMEPISSNKAELAALRAARTTRDTAMDDRKTTDKGNRFTIANFCRCFRSVEGCRCVGYCRTCRRVTKNKATAFLFGNNPFAFRLGFSGVNVFVCCAILFVVIDQIRLAFVPASSEKAVVILSCVVWLVLVIELIFEVLVRPEGYNVLTKSEKAFAPSTARFINSFHLMSETIALALFLPNFRCLVMDDCGDRYRFSLLDASLKAVLGPSRIDVFVGYLFFASLRLRIFGLVRHWKKMWINNTFVECSSKPGLVHGFFLPKANMSLVQRRINPIEEDDMEGSKTTTPNSQASISSALKKEDDDLCLNKAATIGTALMVVNSHRAMLLVVAIVGIMPLLYTLKQSGGANKKSTNLVSVLQANNVRVPNNDSAQCEFLYQTSRQWMLSAMDFDKTGANETSAYLLWAQVLPVRCGWQRPDGLLTDCSLGISNYSLCEEDWLGLTGSPTPSYFAKKLGLRPGVIATHSEHEIMSVEGVGDQIFNVTAIFNQNRSVQSANEASFLLQTTLLVLVLVGLTVLRGDASRLVIYPLRRMLKIVLRYAENPLSPTPTRKRQKINRDGPDSNQAEDAHDGDSDLEKDQLGNYETEQLINAIAKITDLLRKCWGVAGAGIISSNLARAEDGQSVQFNATVPGKRVYALFAFAGIKEFGRQLRALDQEVMKLINDVAKVVHEEVFRWGLGDSGQCNKNLGAAFLMVFRIGDFKEVEEKRARAQKVVFSFSDKLSGKKPSGVYRRRNHRQGRKRGGELEEDILQLATLPGIRSFTDRALLGMLKSYAGIHRDQSLMKWKKDFRLGAGVGAFSVDMIFGMDAGWAVEGAVGSAYKIDATYLSPHVNMASRMMSACKQYGVSILLSQAVQELLSEPAKGKLRHIDTVTVKGTTVEQRIFTFDARHQGADFFLFERTVEQADLDSENYSTQTWSTDQDLQAMRRHVTEDFEEVFAIGRDLYLDGQWGAAIEKLKQADRLMITSVIETGYVENDTDGMSSQHILDTLDQEDVDDEVLKLRNDFGDGPSRCLVSFMEREGGVAPQNWRGVRPLKDK